MRARGCASRGAARRAAGAGTAASWFGLLADLGAGQCEVDLLQRRPPDAEALELTSLRERLRGQLVQHPRRLVCRDDDLPAVSTVADLGCRGRAGQVLRAPVCRDASLAEHR